MCINLDGAHNSWQGQKRVLEAWSGPLGNGEHLFARSPIQMNWIIWSASCWPFVASWELWMVQSTIISWQLSHSFLSISLSLPSLLCSRSRSPFSFSFLQPSPPSFPRHPTFREGGNHPFKIFHIFIVLFLFSIYKKKRFLLLYHISDISNSRRKIIAVTK